MIPGSAPPLRKSSKDCSPESGIMIGEDAMVIDLQAWCQRVTAGRVQGARSKTASSLPTSLSETRSKPTGEVYEIDKIRGSRWRSWLQQCEAGESFPDVCDQVYL